MPCESVHSDLGGWVGVATDPSCAALLCNSEDEAEAEDARLLEHWLSGPGARPTARDAERWQRLASERRVPRRVAVG